MPLNGYSSVSVKAENAEKAKDLEKHLEVTSLKRVYETVVEQEYLRRKISEINVKG